jgi:hypothetical protein
LARLYVLLLGDLLRDDLLLDGLLLDCLLRNILLWSLLILHILRRSIWLGDILRRMLCLTMLLP